MATSRKLCPVTAEISASVQPHAASRVTAVPRRSWNVTPTMAADAQALRHDDRKPSSVHDFLSVLVKMTVLLFVFAASSRAIFNGAPTGITTRAPVFD